jgi:hypothetical protein
MPSPTLTRTRSPDQSPDDADSWAIAQHAETKRVRSTTHRGPSSSASEELLALRLSDDQLTEVMRLCQPLALHCRDALLRILAHELRGRRDVGDGELHRIARAIIKDNRLFDPPDLDGRMPRTGKWTR